MKARGIVKTMPVTIKVQAEDVTKCHHHCPLGSLNHQDKVYRCRLYGIDTPDENRCPQCLEDFGTED